MRATPMVMAGAVSFQPSAVRSTLADEVAGFFGGAEPFPGEGAVGGEGGGDVVEGGDEGGIDVEDGAELGVGETGGGGFGAVCSEIGGEDGGAEGAEVR